MKLIVFMATFFLALCLCADELVVVKAVSTSKKMFVLQKGIEDGVRMGQRRAFSSDKISLLARVAEVKPRSSLWEVVDPNSIFPFDPESIVVETTTTDLIWTDIARLDKEFVKQRKEHKKLINGEHSYSIKGSFSKGISESTTQIVSNQSVSRVGFELGFLYHKILPWTPLEGTLGLHYARDNLSVKSDSEFNILNSRTFLTSDIQYHFEYSEDMGGNLYLSLGFGAGLSSSDIKGPDVQETTKGTVIILPSFKLGFRSRLDGYEMTYEGALESLSYNEKFADGTQQKTNLVMGKISLGVKF